MTDEQWIALNHRLDWIESKSWSWVSMAIDQQKTISELQGMVKDSLREVNRALGLIREIENQRDRAIQAANECLSRLKE